MFIDSIAQLIYVSIRQGQMGIEGGNVMSMRIDTNTLNYYVQNAQISLSVLRTKINNLDQF